MAQRIILYYKFTPVKSPEDVRKWQTIVCAERGLNGRIIISNQGINGTLGGDVEALEDYIEQMEASDEFGGIVYKWSEGGYDHFPKLSVKVRDELVAFKASDELVVTKDGVQNGGKHLKPEELHKLLEEKGDEVVFFDGRNAYEAKIGRFKNAVVPDVKTTPDFLDELASDKYEELKSKPVVTYCTGGIRCEILSALMKNRGFEDVYQMDGGIVKYGETYGDDGVWEGSCYVFDRRMNVDFSDKTKQIGECYFCQGSTNNFTNCADVKCNRLMLVCDDCAERTVCSEACTPKVKELSR